MKNLRAFTFIELIITLSVIISISVGIIYIYNVVSEKHKINETIDILGDIRKNMNILNVTDQNAETAIVSLLENKSVFPSSAVSKDGLINSWKGKIVLSKRLNANNNDSYYNVGFYNIPKSACVGVVSNARQMYTKVENSSGKIATTKSINEIVDFCDNTANSDAIIFSNFYEGDGAYDFSVSTSTSYSVSTSTSNSISVSNSVSTSNSISSSISNSISTSNSISRSNSISVSNSISASNSISTSNSISASNSISNSISASNSVSRSNSISTSNSISRSNSISNSVSVSNSISNSVSVSNSISTSISVSNSLGANKDTLILNKIKAAYGTSVWNITGPRGEYWDSTRVFYVQLNNGLRYEFVPQFKFYSPEINKVVNSGQNYAVLLKSNGTDAGYQMSALNGNVTTLENALKNSTSLADLKNVFSSTGNIAIYNYIISHI